jgi:hypothetical protein
MIPRDLAPILTELFNSDQSEIEKLSSSFHLIVNTHIQHSKNESEIHRATGDRESLVKEQIKHSTMTHLLKVYAECYRQATGSTLILEKIDE